MLLTLSQSGKPDFGPHSALGISSPPSYTRHKPSPPRALSSLLSPAQGNAYAMSTSHRGLPPPSAMTLPDPHRQQPPPPPPPPPTLLAPQIPSGQGALPAPPVSSSHWQHGEDSARQWAHTKAEEERTKQEEERRRQEEERTRQESFKYEQRLVERAILRESIQGGVPPQMIPVIFAGIGGSSLATASVDLLQQYATQLQNVAQHMQPPSTSVSPEQMQQTQMINPPVPNPYAAAPQLPAAIAQAQSSTSYHANSTGSRSTASGPTSAPRSIPTSGLSRINTIDLNHPPAASSQQQSALSEQTASSPRIYFHHWVPPGVQEPKGTNPHTPSGRNEPTSAHPSNLTEPEHKDSPRKRKAAGGHGPIAPPPPPHSSHQQTSPSYSGPSSSRSRGNSSAQQSQARSRPGKADDGESGRGGHFRKDSVANNPRGTHEAYQPVPPDPYSRPPSHAGQHHHMDRRDIR